MKSLEEIKAEIATNSYPVELSNGQTIYIDRLTSRKAIGVHIKNEKSPYGFDEVVYVSREADKAATIERIEDYANHIEMPELIDYKSMSEYKDACSSLIEEIANAILNEPAIEKIISKFETGEVYSRFEEEIKELKQLDIELYNSYVNERYDRWKELIDHDFPSTFDFSLTHHNIIYLVHVLSKNHDIEGIKNRLLEKWDLISDIDD